MTLYLYTRDMRNVSNCSDGCAEAWPPVLTVENAIAGEGLDGERLSTFQREDGSKHVTYNGKPLYYFANDSSPGDTAGQDRGDVWYLVSPDGGPIKTAVTVNAAENGALGTMLADSDGNSLYLYTRDERNVSNCASGCALAWPPVLTVDNPVAGEGLAEDRIGSISRDNVAKQVAYNGWPLYYFAADEKPGDALGQDRGGVWFVLTTDGGAIYTNAPVNSTAHADLGNILVEDAGRSPYPYTKDELILSNCTGGCALAWPPLITVEEPAPGPGVSPDSIGTISREDGSKQVTFNGNPLYYFAEHEKPGDALGQNRGEVWFVIEMPEPLSMDLSASQDDTLYERAGTQVNNGAGQWLFAGRTGSNENRRGLIKFDIAAQIPAAATVTSVSLTLNMSRTIGDEVDVSLHRVAADWQEGKQQAFGNEGSGAEAGDVTWTQRVFDSLDLENEGGDFSSEASASTLVGPVGSFT